MLRLARSVAREAGLRFVYVDKALGAPGRSTDCPECGHTVIRRPLEGPTIHELEDGCCRACEAPLPGRW